MEKVVIETVKAAVNSATGQAVKACTENVCKSAAKGAMAGFNVGTVIIFGAIGLQAAGHFWPGLASIGVKAIEAVKPKKAENTEEETADEPETKEPEKE